MAATLRSAGPNHTTPTSHFPHTGGCELLLHQHFIRRLNKAEEFYKVRPLCMHRRVESASGVFRFSTAVNTEQLSLSHIQRGAGTTQ